jgi:hypothetical protein
MCIWQQPVHPNLHWLMPFLELLLDVVEGHLCKPDSAFGVYIPGLPYLLMSAIHLYGCAFALQAACSAAVSGH